MSLHNTSTSYGSIAKFFHWLIATLIIGMLCYGFFLDDFPKDIQPITYNIHKLIGLSILTLITLRLLWAVTNAKPVLPADVGPWQRFAERIFHFLLYMFAFMMPLAGWIGSMAEGRAPHIGDVTLGFAIPKNKALADAAFQIHGNVAIILITLISLHVLAALYHHFIRRDNILVRMLPNYRRS
jgi:cytochrome b561